MYFLRHNCAWLLNNGPISFAENEPEDFLQKNVVLTVSFLLHQMLFLISRMNRLYTRDYYFHRCTLRSKTIFGLLKMMKNAFYFILKTLIFLKIFNFALTFSSCRKTTWLERLISKFMTSQTGQQLIAIHILPNISRSKGNQTMKLGYLIEYNIRKLFPSKSYTKCSKGTIPRPFSKN